MARELTTKQTQFVEEYFRNGGNATQAVIVVYGCSYEAARTSASRLLTNANIREEIAAQFNADGITWQEFVRMAIEPIVKGLEAKNPDGTDDLDTQLKASDRLRSVLNYCSIRGIECLDVRLVPIPKQTATVPTFIASDLNLPRYVLRGL
jgi:phage terminase small subunit